MHHDKTNLKCITNMILSDTSRKGLGKFIYNLITGEEFDLKVTVQPSKLSELKCIICESNIPQHKCVSSSTVLCESCLHKWEVENDEDNNFCFRCGDYTGGDECRGCRRDHNDYMRDYECEHCW